MESPLMEDVDLVKKLHRQGGRPAIVQKRVQVSSRRWERMGYLRNTLSNLSMLFAYKLGANPHSLAKWYYR